MQRPDSIRFFFPLGGVMPPWDIHGGKGARLISRQISAKMSGGLDKVDCKRLIDLVLQNRIL